MASQWINTASALLGVALGGGITFLIALVKRKHDRAMAREAREQERLADTYVRGLFTARRFGESTQAMTAQPNGRSEHGADKSRRTVLPELKELLEVEAMLNAYGSEAKMLKVMGKKLEARERSELAHVDFGDLDRKLDDLKLKENFARGACTSGQKGVTPRHARAFPRDQS